MFAQVPDDPLVEFVIAAKTVCLLTIVLIVYMLPTFIASRRGHRNTTAISVLNVMLGWTFFGWVVALVWACTHQEGSGNEGPDRKVVQREPPKSRIYDSWP